MGRGLKTVHTSIKSNKKGKEEAIVSQVGYDKNGRTIYTRMFNGTENTNGCRVCCSQPTETTLCKRNINTTP